MSRAGSGATATIPIDPQRVRFVLVGAQSAGNVGSCARALKNLGFSRLSLVAPECDPSSAEARKMAVDAADVLAAARRFDTLDDALEGAGTVVGTTVRRGKQRHPHWPLDGWVASLDAGRLGAGLALVFGREDHGLSDVELDRCTHLVYVPTSTAYPSLNVAQAVLLVAYELWLARCAVPLDPSPDPAGHEQREDFYQHFDRALRGIGFVTDQTAESILRRMRRIFGRASLGADDVRMLRGLARQMLWAADRRGLDAPEPED